MLVTRLGRGSRVALTAAVAGVLLALLPGTVGAASAVVPTVSAAASGASVAQAAQAGSGASAAAEAAPLPRIRLASVGRYLKVNIDPNLSGTKSWTFVLQRRTGAYPWRYVTVGRFRTLGSSETRSMLLPTRTYRVVVPAQHGYGRGVARIRHYADVAAPRVVLDERSVLTLGMPGQPGRGLLHLVVAADDAMGTRPVGTSSGVARVVARRGDQVLGQLRVARLGVLPKNWVDSLNVRVDWDGLVPDHWRSVQVRAWDRSGNASDWTAVPLTVAPKPQIRWRQIDTVSMWLGGTACGVSTTGAAYCWGENPWGMLGGGTDEVRTRQPVRVRGLGSGVVSVSVAKYRACAVKVDGSLWCWGRDRSWTGQPQPGDDLDGDPTPPYLTTPPVRITGLPPVSSVSLAASAACAVTTEGATWCWGSNRSGQLGVGSDAAWVATPSPVTGLGAGTTVDVDGPGYGWCAHTTAGGLRCWGNYLADSQAASPVPVDLPGLTSGVTSLDDSCAVLADGTVRCWGLGYAPFMTDYSSFPSEPQQVPGLDVPVVEYADLCARTPDGAAICRDPMTKRWAPVLGLGTGVAHITGGDAPCAVTRAGVAYCWGAVIGGKNPYDRIPKPYRWTDSPLRVPNPA